MLRRRGLLELSCGHIGLSHPFFSLESWIVFIIIRSADSLQTRVCFVYFLSPLCKISRIYFVAFLLSRLTVMHFPVNTCPSLGQRLGPDIIMPHLTNTCVRRRRIVHMDITQCFCPAAACSSKPQKTGLVLNTAVESFGRYVVPIKLPSLRTTMTDPTSPTSNVVE